jgi:hypothetical protein
MADQVLASGINLERRTERLRFTFEEPSRSAWNVCSATNALPGRRAFTLTCRTVVIEAKASLRCSTWPKQRLANKRSYSASQDWGRSQIRGVFRRGIDFLK